MNQWKHIVLVLSGFGVLLVIMLSLHFIESEVDIPPSFKEKENKERNPKVYSTKRCSSKRGSNKEGKSLCKGKIYQV